MVSTFARCSSGFRLVLFQPAWFVPLVIDRILLHTLNLLILIVHQSIHEKQHSNDVVQVDKSAPPIHEREILLP